MGGGFSSGGALKLQTNGDIAYFQESEIERGSPSASAILPVLRPRFRVEICSLESTVFIRRGRHEPAVTWGNAEFPMASWRLDALLLGR